MSWANENGVVVELVLVSFRFWDSIGLFMLARAEQFSASITARHRLVKSDLRNKPDSIEKP
jgi:hypothetical protein